MKAVYPKMLSQVTKRSSAGFLKRSNGFQVATVRYQSNKTASAEERIKELAAKVAKEHQSDKFNAKNDTDLISQQQGQHSSSGSNDGKKLKKVKRDYSAVPRVPSTKFFSYQEIALDSLMNQHRPLLLFHQKEEVLPSLQELFKPVTFWSQSAVGSTKFTEWDSVPAQVAADLRPFSPPLSSQENEMKKAQDTEQELAGYINSLEYNQPPKPKLKSKSSKAKNPKTRGRYRPSYDFDFDNGDDY